MSSDRKIRISSDLIGTHGENMGFFGEEVIPVDMYGRRVFTSKDEGNQEKAAQDILDYYGLNTKGCQPEEKGSY